MEEDPNQIEDSLDGDGEHDDGHVNKKAKRARNVCVRCRSRKQRACCVVARRYRVGKGEGR